MRSPRLASTILAAAAAAVLLTACASGTPGAHPDAARGTAGVTRSPAPTQDPEGSATASPDNGSSAVIGSCILGVYDQSQNEFYALSGLAHGSDITSGDPVAEAYQVTLADRAGSATATITGFTIAVYASGKKLATTSEHFSAGRLIPAGQSMTFTEYPWGTSSADRGPSVGPLAKGQAGAVNMAATCRLLRWQSG